MHYRIQPWTAVTLVFMALAASPSPAARQGPSYQLRSERTAGQIDRVAVLLEVGGDLKVVEDSKVKRLKTSVVGKLLYDERLLEVSTQSDRQPVRSVRYYDTATAVIKIGDRVIKPTLSDPKRLVCATIEGSGGTLHCPRGSLTRKELDLIDILGNSLLLDRLLPPQQVAIDKQWEHSNELMAALLGLDEISQNETQSVLRSVKDGAARIEMTGRVEGAVGGVSSTVEVKAKYRFDMKSKRIDWFGLLVRENRSIGHVETGTDVVARLQMKISPQAESEQLRDAALKDVGLEPTVKSTLLSYHSSEHGWQFMHDRRWYIISDEHDLAILRMIDRGELVAQCNVSPLAKVSPGRQVTLEKFQEDVRRGLGKSFGQFVRASQWANDADYRVLRVSVEGKVSDLPIRWNYYLVADEHGHQTVFIFTVEAKLLDRFGDADQKLVSTLRFDKSEVTASRDTSKRTAKSGQ